MSEMVERVAAALYEQWARPPSDLPRNWNDAKDYSKTEFREIARTAIAAMREATAEMINAVPMEPTAERVRYYSEMIDAALGEKTDV